MVPYPAGDVAVDSDDALESDLLWLGVGQVKGPLQGEGRILRAGGGGIQVEKRDGGIGRLRMVRGLEDGPIDPHPQVGVPEERREDLIDPQFLPDVPGGLVVKQIDEAARFSRVPPAAGVRRARPHRLEDRRCGRFRLVVGREAAPSWSVPPRAD
jgi:hypothetical protein